VKKVEDALAVPVLKPVLHCSRPPADFLKQFPTQSFLWRFTGLHVPAKEAPTPGSDDPLQVIPELKQPLAVLLHNGQRHFHHHAICSATIAGRGMQADMAAKNKALRTDQTHNR
jgi:hypothetical protein